MPVLAPRLEPAPGPIVGVKLDNEIEVLDWVTHSRDLTDDGVSTFGDFVSERHVAGSAVGTLPYAVLPGDASRLTAAGPAHQVRPLRREAPHRCAGTAAGA